MSPNHSTLVLIVLCILLNPWNILSQTDESNFQEELIIDPDNDDQIERINAQIPDDRLSYYLNHPLDLNKAGESDIMNFPFISDFEAGQINEYISIHKPLLSKYELQSIGGLSMDNLGKMIPYITVDQSEQKIPLLHSMTHANHSSIITRWSRVLQESKGYQLKDSLNAAYLGSADQLFIRLKSAEPGRYSLSVMAEKDAGEPMFDSNIKSFDFTSAHLFLENIHPNIQSLVIGDYNLRLGQGLIIDNGFGLGKNYQFGNIVKIPSVIKPYQSLSESNLLRGIACKLKIYHNLNILLFYSSKPVDGNIIEVPGIDPNSMEKRVSSLQNSGLHRSYAELKDKNTIDLSYAGIALDRTFNALKIGLNVVYKNQNPPFSNKNRIDRIFISEDRKQYFTSVHHQWMYKNLTVCGEWAIDKNIDHAIIESAIFALGKSADAVFSYRNFHPGFYNDLSGTLSTSGLSWNERSIYFAVNVFPYQKLLINGSIDFTAFPWLKYQNDLITGQRDYSLRIQYTERKKWLSYLQFRRRISDLNELNPINNKEKVIILQSSDQLRLHLEIKLNSDWIWRSRIEFHWLNTSVNSEKGMLISQDLLFKSVESRYSGNIRFAIFDVSNYDARIYSFENDVLYQYSLPAYNGRGIRTYINFRFRPASRITLEFKLSTTYLLDSNQNGSGNDLINSAYKSEIKIQFQFHF